MTVELCPTSEASPQGLHEIIPFKRHHHVASVELRPGPEAPPRPPVELCPFRQGTTRDSL